MLRSPENQPSPGRRGLTLVELMVVVLVLGILAALVLPNFNLASNDSKEAALIQHLQTLRRQIQQYQQDHGGLNPGQGSTSPSGFKNAMLLSTDAAGTTGAVGTLPFGPYFSSQLPANPFTNGTGVMIVSSIDSAIANEAAMDGTLKVGWIYSPSEGRIIGNNQGTALDGTALSSF